MLDISYGDITITNDGFTCYVADDTDPAQVQQKTYQWETGEEHKLTITGTSVGTEEPKTPAHVVKITGNDSDNLEITLDKVTIENKKEPNNTPGIVLMSGSATLALKGNNAITGSNMSPAVQINKGAVLTIKDSGDGDGVLVARTVGNNNTAAIGAPRNNTYAINPKTNKADNNFRSGGKPIIKSGTVDAYAAGSGAAIGAGHLVYFGDIVINGGTVKAETQNHYAIATYTNLKTEDWSDEVGGLTINGGTLTAVNNNNGGNCVKVNGFTMNGGTLAEMTKANDTTYFNVKSATITGGNTNDYYDGTAEVSGTKVKLYFFDAESKPLANTEVAVNNWTAMTAADGTITTYLPAGMTSVTYNGREYTLKNGAALLGLAYDAEDVLQWEAGDPLVINIDTNTTGTVCGKVNGDVNVNSGKATLKLVQSEGNTWTVTAKEAATGVTMDVSSVSGLVHFGNGGDYQYQMGYVTADKVKLNPDGGDVTVNPGGSVTWGKYTLTGIGNREIVVNGADIKSERTVANNGGKNITVNGETLATGKSLTIPKALYQQEYLSKADKQGNQTVVGTTASYILPGTTVLNEFAPTKETVKLNVRYISCFITINLVNGVNVLDGGCTNIATGNSGARATMWIPWERMRAELRSI